MCSHGTSSSGSKSMGNSARGDSIILALASSLVLSHVIQFFLGQIFPPGMLFDAYDTLFVSSQHVDMYITATGATL